jgi:hypothetical protein
MTTEEHLMICVSGDGPRSVFDCTVPGCGRRLVLDHVDARLRILHPGSSAVRHRGSTGLVGVTGSVA